jgi:putative SOS response-associated peptidase YedK
VCGRYGMSLSSPQLSEAFPHVDFPLTIAPRYNIAPTQDVLVVRQVAGSARAEHVRWGIDLPPSAPDATRSLINVRSETALRGGFLRALLEHDRVLLPASHFYEWRGQGRDRLPMMIRRHEGMFAFAGLIGRWMDPETGITVPAVAILTCRPNELMQPIHHRMPVILDSTSWRSWLDPRSSVEDLAPLLTPCPDSWLEVRPASRLVNDHRHDGPELLEPSAEDSSGPPGLQLSLFDRPDPP